jgi:hypothetical protein
VDHGIVLFGKRIVIPKAARKNVLKKLHAAHQGIVRTNRRARQTVYWPGITNEITTLLSTCSTCQEHFPSSQQEPMMSDPLPTHVFEDVSADLFQSGQLHVLVYADRLSGLPVVHRWKRDPTAREVLHAVIDNFVELGVPMRFRSDIGPQFDAGVFRTAMDRWGVAVSNSTPNYSQSNGHAEAAVKTVKELVEKISPSGDLDAEEFKHGLLKFRNTPRENGLSPAQMVFGHQLRSIVPAHRSAYATCLNSIMEARDRQAAINADSKTRYDLRSRALESLPIGTNVRVQDPKSKLWSHVGVVVAIGRYRAYRVKFASGSVLWRNRRFLRRLVNAEESEERDADQALTDESDGKDGAQTDTEEPGNDSPSTCTGQTRAAPRAGLPTPRRNGRCRTPKLIVSV